MSLPRREFEVELPLGWVDDAGRVHRRCVIQKMRGHEEALFYDPSLSAGRLVTELIKGCLVRFVDGPEAPAPLVARMFSADRNFLVVQIRRVTLGDEVACRYTCRGCGADIAVTEDLGRLAVRRAGDGPLRTALRVELADGYRDGEGVTHQALELRLPRGDDEEFVAQMTDDPLRARDALVLRCIQSFGSLRRATLEAYGLKILRDLTLGDRRAIYRALDDDSPGVDFRRTVTCGRCGDSFKTTLEVSGFFDLG
ncbi:hypothetical protein SAMN02745121_06897 [Nannocystis exedens]|uniref:T4 bacteriophage base plate protein n=1 Tax=Nannocystis exedens TaxID=54 RepID=A0A1I2FWT6_9BACT|nr:hypothetical protein [Nannocystis exedens]PCC73781.1 hypothetical protein NAEX_06869 [Nannocystis exedens]SFF09413.1 hypothetical protein SAMN02745121_06897 [Nannocystis exedens]